MKLYRLGWMAFGLSQLFDIITSMVSNHVPGLTEGNELLADANGHYMFWVGLVVKTAYTLIAVLPVSYFLKKIIGPWAAALFLLYVAYPTFNIAASNTALSLAYLFHR